MPLQLSLGGKFHIQLDISLWTHSVSDKQMTNFRNHHNYTTVHYFYCLVYLQEDKPCVFDTLYFHL